MNWIQYIQKIQISPEHLKLITEIDEFKGSWKYLSSIAPEKLSKLKKISTIESVGSSNRIEGNKLSDKEVEKLLNAVNNHSFLNRDEEEVAGYAMLMDIVFNNYQEIPFSENYIKQLHKNLLIYSQKDSFHRGEYKKLENNVSAFENGKEIGVILETVSPFDTPFKMAELVAWTNQAFQEKILHSLYIIAVFNVVFLAIHPFQDGNGRLSRILTNLLLLKSGYLYVPYSSLESVIEDNKENYYRALRQTQKTLFGESPCFESWFTFFFYSLHKQKTRLEYKLEHNMQLSISRATDLEKLIMVYFERENTATLQDLVLYTNANRNTLKKSLNSLVQAHKLKLISKGRSSYYTKEVC